MKSRLKFRFNLITRSALVAALALFGCTKESSKPTTDLAASTDTFIHSALVPKPSDPATALAQLQRHRGQTSFLNLAYWYDQCRHCRQDEPSQEQKDGPEQGKREEQESDIFKVGAPGSKLVYLMNNYRGLQVVSFAKGVMQPELIGRAAATGNTPDEMYSLPKNRLLTIEHIYDWGQEEDGPIEQREDFLRSRWVDRSHSRMLVYDVANPEKPVLTQTISAYGMIVDSRIVGDVLYVASKQDKTGHIASYSLTAKSLNEVAHHTLAMKVSDAQNMNILSVEKGGSYSYYLVATLSEKEWGWWDDSSIVEVIDISDAKGQIEPSMAVAARGVVRERSQTLIKNDTLIVTSNYNVRNQQSGLPARIAVETFKLPTRTSEIITEKEETYRRLHIERQLQNLSGKKREEMFEILANDPVLGIRGRFVRTSSGTLRKLVNDSIVTVGDGSGLNANLRDVRYQGDLMYAFWVPQNEIDPFDLFDISHPELGVKYLNRLHFDGWIDRAIPITNGGRRFVVGLGWIVPVVNDETGRRQPQAMVFEILEQAGKLRAVDVAQLSFEGSNVWTDFNGQDKMIEVRFQGEGKGEILFGASKWDEATSFASGGQLVRFDTGAILRGEYDKVLSKGDFLNGGADWIRRVFTNPEIDRINSFSDRQLATYDQATPNGSGDLKPISFLELARDIRSYQTLSEGPKTTGVKTYGVQIVDDSGWWSSQDAKTELRLVDGEKADSEKAGVLNTVSINGSYLDSMIEASTSDLLVATIRYSNVQRSNGTYQYSSIVHVTRLAVVSGKLSVKGEVEWEATETNDPEPEGMKRDAPVNSGIDRALVQLPDGTILAQANSTVHKLDLSSGLSSVAVTFTGCSGPDRSDVTALVIDGQPFVSSVERFENADYGVQVERRYLARAAITGAEAKCEAAINIPGRPMLVTKTGEVLVSDQWVEDVRMDKIVDDEPEGRADRQRLATHFTTVTSLISLKLSATEARLVDEEPMKQDSSSGHTIVGGKLARVVNDGSGAKVEFLSLSANAELNRTAYRFDLSLGKEASLVFVTETAPGERLGVVRSGQNMQTIRWSDAQPRPLIVKMQMFDPQFQKLKETETLRLNDGWYATNYHYSPTLHTLEVSQGLTGLAQILLTSN